MYLKDGLMQVSRKDPYDEVSHLDINTILEDVVRRGRRPELPAKCPAEARVPALSASHQPLTGDDRWQR